MTPMRPPDSWSVAADNVLASITVAASGRKILSRIVGADGAGKEVVFFI
jgi:hypothetical protein